MSHESISDRDRRIAEENRLLDTWEPWAGEILSYKECFARKSCKNRKPGTSGEYETQDPAEEKGK